MILVVHPLDPSTKALNRVGNHLKESLPEVRIFKVHPNEKSRFASYEAIRNCKSNDIIVFLGHGSSCALYGSKGNMYDPPILVPSAGYVQQPVQSSHPAVPYSHPRIHEHHTKPKNRLNSVHLVPSQRI